MKFSGEKNQHFQEYLKLYDNNLCNDVLPFWLNYSPDKEYGGFFTCLDRFGNVFDTDKFIWLQSRQVWTFAMLYNRFRKENSWLEMAQMGVEFLKKHGRDDNGYWYFSLNREGKPLIQPYNLFSDCFAAMGFAQYAIASEDEASAEIAKSTYQNILSRKNDPKGPYNKAYPGTRPLRSFAFPMIMSNVLLELEPLLDQGEVEEGLQNYTNELFDNFLDPEKNIFYEFVLENGHHVDSMDGRLINPGHGIEGAWFLMDIAERQNDQKMIGKLISILLDTLDFGWDQEYGGIFYFKDAENKPPQQLEWDQKLWWVHLETLVALSKAYLLTGDLVCWEWYQKVHEYTWNHFPDPEYGEWYGYLNRQGDPHISLKGGKWKGCFHVPRSLLLCRDHFEKLATLNH